MNRLGPVILLVALALTAACSPFSLAKAKPTVVPIPIATATAKPTAVPMPTATIDPQCKSVTTLAYIIEANRISIAFVGLTQEVYRHSDAKNFSAVRKDAQKIASLSGQLRNFSEPPVLLAEYNGYVAQSLLYYAKGLNAEISGDKAAANLYLEGYTVMLDRAVEEWNEAYRHCGGWDLPTPFAR